MKISSPLRWAAAAVALAGLGGPLLVGCDGQNNKPAAATGTTIENSANKTGTGDTGSSVVSGKPTLNPGYRGGTGTKLR